MIESLINEYINIYGKRKFLILRAFKCYFEVPKFRVVVLIRYAQKLNNLPIKKRVLKKLKLKYSVDVGINTRIGDGFWVEHYTGMVIGDGVKIGENCTVYQGVTLGQRKGKYPEVLNNVTIYPNTIILGDIIVGNNAQVLAGSIVINDVPDNAVVAGNPAKFKRLRNEGISTNR